MIKPHHPKSIGLLILITLFSTAIGFAQDNVLLKIVDIQSGEPIENVKARVKGYPGEYMTNHLGYLELKNLQQAGNTVTVSHGAYLSGQIAIPESASKLVIQMERNYLNLGDIVVLDSPEIHLSQVRHTNRTELPLHLKHWVKEQSKINDIILQNLGETLKGLQLQVKFKSTRTGEILDIQSTDTIVSQSDDFMTMMTQLQPLISKINTDMGFDGYFTFNIGNQVLSNLWFQVDEEPMPPGGYYEYQRLLKTELIYPQAARDNKFEGRISVGFTVNKDGSLSEFDIVEPRGFGTSEEAIRLVKSLGNWAPGKIRGVPVKVRKFVAVNFRLADEVSDYDLKNWLQSRIYYPQEAIQNKIHGKIYLSFNYDFNAKAVTDVKLHNDIGFGCGRTALNVFNQMPTKFLNDVTGKSGQYLLPIWFKFENTKSKEKGKVLPVKGASLLEEITVMGYPVDFNMKQNGFVVDVGFTSVRDLLEKYPRTRDLNFKDRNLLELDPKIGKLQQLKTLNLEGNFLSTIPKEIYDIKGLWELYLNDNEIDYLPEGISKLKQLYALGLGFNNFKRVPGEIWELNYLQVLDLRGLGLTELDSKIGGLKNLEVLVLDDNPISELPGEIFKLKKLRELHLVRTSFLSSEVEFLKKKFKDVEIVFY